MTEKEQMEYYNRPDKFKIITEITSKDFERALNNAIEDGYKLSSQLTVVQNNVGTYRYSVLVSRKK